MAIECVCGHEERHHDNEASKCDKIDCGCGLFRPDSDDLQAQIAALQTENTRLRDEVARRGQALEPFAKVAESHSFPPSVPPEKCILWNKTSSIQGTLVEITLADCIAAQRELREASDG